MSATLKAMKKSTTGKRSNRNFITAPSLPVLLPPTHGFARRFVAGPHDEAAGRHRDRVFRPLGHRHIRRAAVERIGEGHVLMMLSKNRPKVEAGSSASACTVRGAAR